MDDEATSVPVTINGVSIILKRGGLDGRIFGYEGLKGI